MLPTRFSVPTVFKTDPVRLSGSPSVIKKAPIEIRALKNPELSQGNICSFCNIFTYKFTPSADHCCNELSKYDCRFLFILNI